MCLTVPPLQPARQARITMSLVIVIVILVLRGFDPYQATAVAAYCASVAAQLAVLLGGEPQLRCPSVSR